jgi:hypothetical protein
VREVDRAVERVDHPTPRPGGVGDESILLGEDRVVGEGVEDPSRDEPLTAGVGVGDQVARPLLAGLDPPVGVPEQFARRDRHPLRHDLMFPVVIAQCEVSSS